jgi:hypothetical protein
MYSFILKDYIIFLQEKTAKDDETWGLIIKTDKDEIEASNILVMT